MKIGIVGSGQIGATLTRQYSKAGHQLKIANARDANRLAELGKKTGAKPSSLQDVAVDVDVLVISVPLIEVPNLSKSLGDSISKNTVVVDTTNYYPIRDGRIDDIENGVPESVWVSKHLQRTVVKVYNSILAGSLVKSGLPMGSSGRIALPISGDDEPSKILVSDLVNDSGFDALDIGNLQDSWRQQPGSPIYCTDLNLSELTANLTDAKKDLLPGRRERALQFILKQNPDHWMSWWKDCVQNNRRIYESQLMNRPL